MSRLLRILAISALVLSCAILARAGQIDDLAAHLAIQEDGNCPPVYLGCQHQTWVSTDWWFNNYQHNLPYAVTGQANFNPVAPPWQYSYLSDMPVWFEQQGPPPPLTYNAVYGIGGAITINGPDGLLFTGMITSGSYEADYTPEYDGRNTSGDETAQFSFSGTWSDGTEGYGTVYNFSSFHTHAGPDGSYAYFHNAATLDMEVVPEPGSLLLVGGGLLLTWKRAVSWR